MIVSQEHIDMAFSAFKKFGFAKYIKDMDDGLACIYMAIFKALKGYNPEKGKLSTYIYHKVRGECLYHIRKQKNKHIALYADLDLMPAKEPASNTLDEKYAPLYDLFVAKMNKRDVAQRYNMSLKQLRQSVKTLRSEFLTDMGF